MINYINPSVEYKNVIEMKKKEKQLKKMLSDDYPHKEEIKEVCAEDIETYLFLRGGFAAK